MQPSLLQVLPTRLPVAFPLGRGKKLCSIQAGKSEGSAAERYLEQAILQHLLAAQPNAVIQSQPWPVEEEATEIIIQRSASIVVQRC